MKTLKSAADSSSKEQQGRSSAQEGSTKKGVVGFPSHTPPSVLPNQPAQFKSVKIGKGKKDETTVDWEESSLKGSDDPVGIDMTAQNLHWGNVDAEGLVGTPPKASAQKDLMANLPTQPSLKSTDKYIKGHLLNHNIGGPGEDYNMFPITGSANKAHLMFVEADVKKWVRGGHHVDYRVKVGSITDNSDQGAKKGTVNATFECYAKNLTDDTVISTNITSEYNAKATATDDDKDSILWDEKAPDGFDKSSLLGQVYDAVAKDDDQAKVDNAIKHASDIFIDTLKERMAEKSENASKILQEMFNTKGKRFTDKQEATAYDVLAEIFYAFIVNQDADEQTEYENMYPTAMKWLKDPIK
ncbi:MAG: hypothetical protein FD123_3560 [Bacteroidetes bacterium]|nr:MAG: hypothetical protein FD123_3560 [Bacteroidota bacterium]